MNLNLLLDSGIIKELQHHDRKNTPLDLLKDDWDELGGKIRIYIEEVMAMNCFLYSPISF
jgi:hypothetical protein